jgi:dihydroorotate dehydrogenase (fumarate)
VKAAVSIPVAMKLSPFFSATGMLRHGIGFLTTLVEGLQAWMEAREYDSVTQLRGSMSQVNSLNPGAFERANYIRILENYKAEYE